MNIPVTKSMYPIVDLLNITDRDVNDLLEEDVPQLPQGYRLEEKSVVNERPKETSFRYIPRQELHRSDGVWKRKERDGYMSHR